MLNRIKELRLKNNFKQIDLCKQIGVTQGALSGWETEKYEPDIKSLNKMAQIFNVSIDYLLGRENKKGIKIPVLGRVAAGIPIEAIEEILDYEEITPEMARLGEYFALQIKGDSMEPLIRDKDIVIVRKQEDADNGDTVIAYVNGYDATCKRLKKQENGIVLIPNNPAYEPMYYSKEDILEIPVTIVGKVVELRRKF